jgi:hypothetical protein
VLEKEGEKAKKSDPSVTITKITVCNPGLFMAIADLGSDSPRLVVHNSMSDTLTIGEVEYMLVAQMCSVMSVFWQQNPADRMLSQLDAARQRQAALIVYANQTPDAQFEYARGTLGYQEVTQEQVLAQVGQPTGFTRLLLYTDRHVSAATVGPRGIVYFDPENGTADTIDQLEMVMYVSGARRFLAQGAAAS